MHPPPQSSASNGEGDLYQPRARYAFSQILLRKSVKGSLSIVGTDCSSESLKLCEQKTLSLAGAISGVRKVYQGTQVVNLEKAQTMFKSNSFDGVTCVGTTSYLHDFDMIFGEWCRMCKKGAIIVFTHRTNIWDADENNVQTTAKKFEKEGKWRCVSMSEKRPYMPKNPVAEEAAKTIYYCVYEVLEHSKFDAAAALHTTAKNHDGAVGLYDAWADTYDDSLTNWGYEAPGKVAELLWGHVKAGTEGTEVRVMDCGCGTGMSGEAILSAGVKKNAGRSIAIVGTDCSPESLKLCEQKKLSEAGSFFVRKVYRETEVVNLEKVQTMFEDGSFDGVTCVGTTSYLHDFDMIFGEWCRMCKKGAIIVFTHRTNIWDADEHNVQTTAKKFEKEGKWRCLSRSEKCPYMPKNPVPEEAAKTIYYCVYEVLKDSKFDAAAALHVTAKNHDGAVGLYDAWADTYDDSLTNWGYEAPGKVAELLWGHVKAGAEGTEVRVMDCGCGTGMSGEAILSAGVKKHTSKRDIAIVGTDCSPESLKLCEQKTLRVGSSSWWASSRAQKVYQATEVVNLEKTQHMFKSDTFDGVTCVGTTSYLHDFDMIFGEWCRMCKKGAIIVFTHRTNIWDADEHNVQTTAKKFEKEGKWRCVSMSEKRPYMPKNPVAEEAAKTIYYCVYEVLKDSKFDAAAALHATAKNHDGAVGLYDAWADTYDDSLTNWGYEAPGKVAELLWGHVKAGAEGTEARVMDCGCGTGMSGEAILSAGVKKNAGRNIAIVGTDCSPESLKLCEQKTLSARKVYQGTQVVNLEKEQTMFKDNSFDGVTCVGTTSYLHNFDMIFGEWCRMCKKGAIIVFTHRTNIWDADEHNVQTTAKKFEKEGKWRCLSRSEKRPYMPKNPVPEEAAKTIYYCVYEVLKDSKFDAAAALHTSKNHTDT